MPGISLYESIDAILLASERNSIPVYVVGGAVRDLLVDGTYAQYDLDVLVDGSSSVIAKSVAASLNGKATFYERFLTAKVTFPEFDAVDEAQSGLISAVAEIDFASARTETYSAPGQLPTVLAGPLERDLKRRDFSINAMALPLVDYRNAINGSNPSLNVRSVIIDPFDGSTDLNHRIVRILHGKSFEDDPTRLLRAARYRTRLNGSYEAQTQVHLKDAREKGILGTISLQRYIREIFLGLEEPAPSLFCDELLRLELFYGHLVVESSLVLLRERLLKLASSLPEGIAPSDLNALRRYVGIGVFASILPPKEFKNIPVPAVERKRLEAILADPLVSFGRPVVEDVLRRVFRG